MITENCWCNNNNIVTENFKTYQSLHAKQNVENLSEYSRGVLRDLSKPQLWYKLWPLHNTVPFVLNSSILVFFRETGGNLSSHKRLYSYASKCR